MKEIYYITGTSSGIGHHLTLEALKTGATVYGISRNCTIEHENYTHISLDLGDLNAVQTFEFQDKNCSRVILINNAGTLGEIKYVGESSEESIINAFNINLIAPALLMNKYLKSFPDDSVKRLIFNISSGAAQNPYDGWSSYCSTKAGLDMYGKVIATEQKLRKSQLKVMSVSPGIIGTNMQAQIRASGQNDFSLQEKFVGFYENNDLKTPEYSAKELMAVIQNQEDYDEVVFDLRYS